MSKINRYVTIMLSLALLTFSAAAPMSAQAKAASGELQAKKLAFAYADKTGKRLLAAGVTSPQRFTQAIHAPGMQKQAIFVKQQKATEKSNGRQNEWNFNQDEGGLFKLAAGKILHNSSVLLAEKDAFQGHRFLKYQAVKDGKLEDDVIAAVEKAKKRKVVKQGLLGSAPSGVRIALVEFERVKGEKPLASLLLKTEQGLLFQDFVGTEDEYSTWRVDDGGEISAQDFRILFVTASDAGYSLAYEWFGAEGSSLEVLQQQKTKFRSVLEGYRYTAPV
ncbi:hypothetical protein [Cohnella boryungensis]|uniref:Uncharacterized protein n=1 Tax=Cohnella boryungensis TaxID=768479 RepID=A0ABV8S6A8_9BACL